MTVFRRETSHARRSTARFPSCIFCLQPRTKSGIGDLRLIAPETSFEFALDAQVFQLKLDGPHAFRKVPSDIAQAYIQSRDRAARAALVLHRDDHGPPPLLDFRRRGYQFNVVEWHFGFS